MGIRILVDEDSQAKALVGQLRSYGHDVVTASEAGLGAAGDESVLAHARTQNRVLLTRNASDFHDLHEANPNHAGIFAIFQGSNPSKNMSYSDIVRAIGNLESANLEFAGQFVALNAWNY